MKQAHLESSMDQRDVQGMARKPVTNMIDRLDAAYSFTGHFNAPEVQPHSKNYHIVRYSGNTESNSLHISARLIVGQVKETSATLDTTVVTISTCCSLCKVERHHIR